MVLPQGSVLQTSGPQYSYEVATVVNGESTVLNVDLSGMPLWVPDWAEAVYEAYFITSCDQLTPTQTTFTNIVLQTTEQTYNSIPWSPYFLTTNPTAAKAICNGQVRCAGVGCELVARLPTVVIHSGCGTDDGVQVAVDGNSNVAIGFQT